MQKLQTYFIADEQAMLAWGRTFASQLSAPLTVYLQGQLGAGKTTLMRGILQGLGHHGAVKSPTYTLVEAYQLATCQLFHFDLYRLADSEELEYIGIRDYQEANSLSFFEWPDKGLGAILPADKIIDITLQGAGRLLSLQEGRS